MLQRARPPRQVSRERHRSGAYFRWSDAFFAPARRPGEASAGILLITPGWIGRISVMAMFIGVPMMLIGLAIILLDYHGRRAVAEHEADQRQD